MLSPETMEEIVITIPRDVGEEPNDCPEQSPIQHVNSLIFNIEEEDQGHLGFDMNNLYLQKHLHKLRASIKGADCVHLISLDLDECQSLAHWISRELKARKLFVTECCFTNRGKNIMQPLITNTGTEDDEENGTALEQVDISSYIGIDWNRYHLKPSIHSFKFCNLMDCSRQWFEDSLNFLWNHRLRVESYCFSDGSHLRNDEGSLGFCVTLSTTGESSDLIGPESSSSRDVTPIFPSLRKASIKITQFYPMGRLCHIIQRILSNAPILENLCLYIPELVLPTNLSFHLLGVDLSARLFCLELRGVRFDPRVLANLVNNEQLSVMCLGNIHNNGNEAGIEEFLRLVDLSNVSKFECGMSGRAYGTADLWLGQSTTEDVDPLEENDDEESNTLVLTMDGCTDRNVEQVAACIERAPSLSCSLEVSDVARFDPLVLAKLVKDGKLMKMKFGKFFNDFGYGRVAEFLRHIDLSSLLRFDCVVYGEILQSLCEQLRRKAGPKTLALELGLCDKKNVQDFAASLQDNEQIEKLMLTTTCCFGGMIYHVDKFSTLIGQTINSLPNLRLWALNPFETEEDFSLAESDKTLLWKQIVLHEKIQKVVVGGALSEDMNLYLKRKDDCKFFLRCSDKVPCGLLALVFSRMEHFDQSFHLLRNVPHIMQGACKIPDSDSQS